MAEFYSIVCVETRFLRGWVAEQWGMSRGSKKHYNPEWVRTCNAQVQWPSQEMKTRYWRKEGIDVTLATFLLTPVLTPIQAIHQGVCNFIHPINYIKALSSLQVTISCRVS